MKQLSFPILSSLPEPMNAPDAVVASCKTEADAVRVSLGIAKRRYGRTQAEVAKLCGWKSDSFLSELKKNKGKTVPDMRVRPFMYATGCCLLEQFHERLRTINTLTGTPTQRDQDYLATALCIKAWDGEVIDRRRAVA